MVERLLEEARKSPLEYPEALPVLEQLNLSLDQDIPNKIFDAIYIHSDRIYKHSIAQINFTTYDCRRDQDTLNSSMSRRDIMCRYEESPFAVDNPTNASGQPTELKRFSYARLLGVFHVNIIYGGPGMLDHGAPSGLKLCHLLPFSTHWPATSSILRPLSERHISFPGSRLASATKIHQAESSLHSG